MLVDMGRLMGLGFLFLTVAVTACGTREAPPDAGLDASVDLMCTYTDISAGTGSACSGGVSQGTCFEEPRCVCVSPEGIWVCCSAGDGYRDQGFKSVGDPCCGYGNAGAPDWPGYPCYCDVTYHWACPAGLDLGATD